MRSSDIWVPTPQELAHQNLAPPPPEPHRYSLSDLRIRTKDKRLVPFVPNAIQQSYLDTICPNWRGGDLHIESAREIILKSRQFGFSTLILALLFLDTINTPNTQTVVVAHDLESTIRLFQMVQRFYAHLPEPKPRAKYANRREFYWPDLDSSFSVGTAGNGEFGRGATISNVHASEVAFWPDGEEIMTALLQSVPPHGNVFQESTANGVGNYFFSEYERAQTGQSALSARFFPWFAHPEYALPASHTADAPRVNTHIAKVSGADTASHVAAGCIGGVGYISGGDICRDMACHVRATKPTTPNEPLPSPACGRGWHEVPGEGTTPPATQFTEEEEQQRALYALTDAQLLWRRMKLREPGMRQKFVQEFPANPREAFISSGSPYFDLEKLDALAQELKDPCFDPLPIEIPTRFRNLRRERQNLQIWQSPRKGSVYVIGADTAEGISTYGDHDFDSASVWEVSSGEQVAHLHGHFDTHAYGLLLAELGFWFNTALLGIERNNHGHAVINAALYSANYPEALADTTTGLYLHQEYDEKHAPRERKPGFPTTAASKYFILDELATAVETGDFHPRSRALVADMMRFVRLPGGKAGGEAGAHDDRVMDAALARRMLNLRPRHPTPFFFNVH